MKSKELAYWVGVAQSDGHYREYFEKRKSKLIHRIKIQLGVKEKSLPMFHKFIAISQKIFGTSGNISINNQGTYVFEIKIKRFIEKIRDLNINFSDPPKPPNWCLKNKEFFGAYLAGVADRSVDELELSIRSSNVLMQLGIRTIGDLLKYTQRDIIKSRNCGRKTLNDIQEALKVIGIHNWT